MEVASLTAAHHTAPAPAAPPRLVRGGEQGLLNRALRAHPAGWRAKRDGVVQDARFYRALMNYPG